MEPEPDPDRWNREDWSGFVAAILAGGVVLVLIILALGIAFGSFEPKSQAAGYAGIFGALVGGLLSYLGSRNRRRGEDEE